jgi:hypothetical protein
MENIKVCTVMKVKWAQETHTSYREGRRSIYFGLFHVVHKCLSEITLTYALKPVVLCLRDAMCIIEVFNSISGWKLRILILLQLCLFGPQ